MAHVGLAVARARGDHRGQHGVHVGVGEEEIDELRAGVAVVALRQLQRRHELLGHGPRLGLQRLGEDECHIRGDVAVLGLTRALQRDVGHGRAQPLRGPAERRADRLLGRHLSVESFLGFASGLGSDLDSGLASLASVGSFFSPARL